MIYNFNKRIRENGDTFNIEDNEYLECIREAILNDSYKNDLEFLDKVKEKNKDF